MGFIYIKLNSSDISVDESIGDIGFDTKSVEYDWYKFVDSGTDDDSTVADSGEFKANGDVVCDNGDTAPIVGDNIGDAIGEYNCEFD
eukprot:CAMPEP_0114682562 /NCGR_PEP_ID=MMETSP0191-20121206/56729_1 /TAXON_ID=126664 /ORGANISM="Sorites sp." /LENGTH=86 /DNA_ID=CAMNT_0001962423 /DNA_START=1486 /DNA_END=1747 /DNA_ORIENTATION=+